MDIVKFIEQRPYLYHLTCKENAENIIEKKELYSASELVRLSDNDAYKPMMRLRRQSHEKVIVNGKVFYLRDQRPISEVNLAKCLTDGWSIGDFLYHLNKRVFMWPTLPRLWSHYTRYKNEKPVILRFETKELIVANPHVKFSRLNSGATRSNSYLGGAPPERGTKTFLPAGEFDRAIRDVAEVAFERVCKIVGKIRIGSKPDGTFYIADK